MLGRREGYLGRMKDEMKVGMNIRMKIGRGKVGWEKGWLGRRLGC